MRLVKQWKDKLGMSLRMREMDSMTYDAREMCASDMIPYAVHYDDHTVITKDKALVQVIKIDGLYFDSLDDEQIRQFTRHRNTVLRTIANSNRGIYVHLVRRKIQSYPDGDPQTWFSRQFNDAWKKHCGTRSFYVNDIYISVVRNRFRQGVPGLFDRVLSGITGSRADLDQEESFDVQAKDIEEATDCLLQTLSAYGAQRLGIIRQPVWKQKMIAVQDVRRVVALFGLSWQTFEDIHGAHQQYAASNVQEFLGPDISELGGFFHYLINLEDARVPVTVMPLHQMLGTSWLNFNTTGNTMSVQQADAGRIAAILSMAEWPAVTPSHMLDEFLQQPVECIITQSFFFTDRITAEHDMRQQKRRLAVNEQAEVVNEDTGDIAQGLQDLIRGRSVNGLHHLTVLVHVPVTQDECGHVSRQDDLNRLDKHIALIKKAFVKIGVKPVREWFALETFFWSQLPGQSQHLIGRRGQIKSGNFAGFASLHNYARGKRDNNLWGAAIMPFETASGTPYHFNFHREIEGMVAGHTAFTADTGAGKTTLLAALIAMADKAHPRVFWFDNREGAKVFMCAMGAQHRTLSAQGNMQWNPFRLPDTEENRAYLVTLLSLMRTCYGGAVSPDDVSRFKKAVIENYSLPEQDRRLRNIAWCFGQDALADVMRIWHGAGNFTGANAGMFDNDEDLMDLDTCRYYCFEMQQLIKDGCARPELAVMLSYPFHCIEQAMNGEPFIMVLEEGQNLVRHAYWREKIDSYIMQIRRKNGVLIFVTPDPKYLYCETDAIQKQTVTKIFLPNGQARHEDYVEQLGLSNNEFEFIRDTPTESRQFLIRRGNESVKAIFDLSALPEFLPVLSSNDRGVALMEEVRSELQSDLPEVWVPVFMQRAMAAKTHNLSIKEV
jgi:type IV secretion system protein VirB4